MTTLSSGAARWEVIQFLERDGLRLDPIGSTGSLQVGSVSEREFAHAPVLELPADLLLEYLEDMGESIRGAPEPLREALSLTKIHVLECLTTDHGNGRNAVRSLGFRRTRSGRVGFFVEQDRPVRPGRAAPDDELEWVADPDVR